MTRGMAIHYSKGQFWGLHIWAYDLVSTSNFITFHWPLIDSFLELLSLIHRPIPQPNYHGYLKQPRVKQRVWPFVPFLYSKVAQKLITQHLVKLFSLRSSQARAPGLGMEKQQ